MKNDRAFFFMMFGLFYVLMAGCTTVQVVPEDLEGQLNQDISFAQLLEAPLEHKGKIFVIGGKVLSAKRLENATQIEVLQLPLNTNMKPGESLQNSQGRFIAIEEDFLDPATLPPGTWVTVVGEVSDMMTLPLDETTYDFPTLVIKRLTVWRDVSTYYPAYRPYPYIYPYWGSWWW